MNGKILKLFIAFICVCSSLFAQNTDNVYWYQSGIAYSENTISCSISNDGKYCLAYTNSSNSSAKLFNIQTQSLDKIVTIGSNIPNKYTAESVYLSPDCKQIFTNDLCIYDIGSGQKVGTFEDSIRLSNIQISLNGKYLAGITQEQLTDDQTIMVYDIGTKKKLYTFSHCYGFQISNNNIYYLRYYKDYDTDSLFVFSLSENHLINKLKSGTFDLHRMHISCDEKWMLAFSNDNPTVDLYSLPEMKHIKSYPENSFGNPSLCQNVNFAFSSSNPSKVAFFSENSVTIRDINNLSKIEKTYTLPGVLNDPYNNANINFSGDGKYIMVCNNPIDFHLNLIDYFCNIINLETNDITPIFNCNGLMGSLSFTSDSKKLITYTRSDISQKFLQTFDIDNRNLLCKLQIPNEFNEGYAGYIESCTSLSVSHNGLVAVPSNSIFVFPDTLSGTYIYNEDGIAVDSAELMQHNCFELKGHNNYLHSLYFSNDDKYLVSGGADSNAIIWDIAARKEIKRFHFDDEVFLAKPSDDFSKLYLVTGDLIYKGEKRVTVLNISDGSTIYQSNDIPIYQVRGMLDAISPDNKYIAVYSSDMVSNIYLFNCDTYQLNIFNNFTTDHSSNDSITSLTFSPDGRTLAVGYRGKTVSFFDVETGNNLKTLTYGFPTLPSDPIIKDNTNAVCFSPDSKYFAASNIDCSAIIWENPFTAVQENGSSSKQDICEIYPNPVSDILNVRINTDNYTNALFRIYDILGNLLYEGRADAGCSMQQINTANLPKGYFILEYRNGSKILSKPFVKL